MSTHNICFRGEIRKIAILVGCKNIKTFWLPHSKKNERTYHIQCNPPYNIHSWTIHHSNCCKEVSVVERLNI